MLPIIGMRTVAQLEDNLKFTSLTLSPEHIAALDEASAIDPRFPHILIAETVGRSAAGQDVEMPSIPVR